MKATSCLIVACAALTLGVRPVSFAATPLAQSTTSSTTPKAASPKVDDKTLTDRIEAKLNADASLKKYDIDVDVTNAVAKLTGSVRAQAEKDRAARVAHVSGIARVDNELKLDKDAGKSVGDKTKEGVDTAGKKTAEGLETAGHKTKEGVETAGEKTKDAVSKTGEVINDSWITTKVHSTFMGEDALKGSDINVDTTNHVVTLKGTVKSEAGRARAVALAKKVEGVNRVVDHLTIK